MAFRSEPLNGARHDLTALGSGEPSMDGWLRERAAGAQNRRVGKTFVWVADDGDPDLVVGYYTLAGHRLVRSEWPRALGDGSPAEIPAVLLARLALDKTMHGFGLGGVLLVDALERVLIATQQVAARVVVVDALHEEAAGFYVRHGFKRIPGTMRLVQKVSEIASSLDVD